MAVVAEKPLKAPFPYFGGKSKVADLVWEHLGDVDNYVEAFCGSAAVLLRRPHEPRIETANDADCMVANFWRATGVDPAAVAAFADGPVNEADMHARHRWLVLSEEAKAFRLRMRTDPGYYDPKIAGWWCWGLCCWIGGGWCTAWGETADGDRKQCIPEIRQDGKGVTCKPRGERPEEWNQRPITEGRGIHPVNVNGRPQLADQYARGRGVHGNDSAGNCAQRRAWLVEWFGRLRDRLRTVRVCCGDWRRVCESHSVTTRLGVTGIFFDPPYSAEADRDNNLYAVECGTVAHDVRAYCLERGTDPMMRICLAGYAGEGHEALVDAGWLAVPWKAHGGYGVRSEKGRENAARERLWFSPNCLKPGAGELLLPFAG